MIWHTLNTNNTGLFEHAIAQSPNPWGPTSVTTATTNYNNLLSLLNISATGPEEQVAALRAVPAETMVNATANLTNLYPVVDGVTVKGDENTLVSQGEHVNLTSMIIGDNDDEGWVCGIVAIEPWFVSPHISLFCQTHRTLFAIQLGLVSPLAVSTLFGSFGPSTNATLHELYPPGTTALSAFLAAADFLGDVLVRFLSAVRAQDHAEIDSCAWNFTVLRSDQSLVSIGFGRCDQAVLQVPLWWFARSDFGSRSVWFFPCELLPCSLSPSNEIRKI